MIGQFNSSNTFNLEDIIALQAQAEALYIPTVTNGYLETFTIPPYNPVDTTHVIIPSEEPFTADTFNNAEFKHFYIEAGTHIGRPEILESGDIDEFKTISPLDTNIHPARLADNLRSKVSLKFTGSEYWIVSGLCDNGEGYFDWGEYGNFQLGNNTSNIILDQLYFQDFNIPINIKYYTDSHTVQKCYFDEPASVMLTLDQSCIQIIDSADSYDMKPCTNHKLVLNDFKNYKPNRLANVYQNVDAVDYSGLVVDSNSAWYDETHWCDSDGTPNTEGEYSLIESGWGGVKAASRDINNPVIYSNNTMTGAKQIYPQVQPPLSPGSGGGFATPYYDAQYVNQYGNVLSNCAGGIVLTSRSGSIEATSCKMEYNIMHNCGSDNSNKCPIKFQTAGESTVRYNVIKDCVDDWATMYSLNSEGNYFGNNDVINTSFTFYDDTTSTSVDGLATNNDMSTAQGNAKYTYDYTITTHRYTNTPEETVIPAVLQMTQEEFVQSIWNMSGVNVGVENPYLEPVSIPSYVDTGDDTDGLITESNGRWNSTYLNREDIQHFYVEPGNYGEIVLTRSGTASQRRTISLHNGNDTHPGKLATNELALYQTQIEASYWTIDRAAWLENGTLGGEHIMSAYLIWIGEDGNGSGSSFNILNRGLVKDSGNGWMIGRDCNNNTVQKFRYDTMTHNNRKSDVMATMIKDVPQTGDCGYMDARNNKWVLGEIKNANDGFHVARLPCPTSDARQDGRVDGTVVDSCDYYITDEIYTDGNGNYTTSGTYAYAEDAIDIKIGSEDASNPCIYTNNHFWGYRTSDSSSGSLISGGGGAIVVHYGVNNSIFDNNICFDNGGGFSSGDNANLQYSMGNSFVRDNIFAIEPTVVKNDYAIQEADGGLNNTYTGNAVFNAADNPWIAVQYTTNATVQNNDLVNFDTAAQTPLLTSNTNLTMDNNPYYATPADGGYLYDYTFTTDKYTESPRDIVVPNILKVAQS